MPKHERFEELCAAASIGQASGGDLAELREHLEWCSSCQECYAEFVGLNAARYAKNTRDEELGREEAISSIDSTLFRERFLRKAAAQGIVFSGADNDCALPEPKTHSIPQSWHPSLARACAALAVSAAIAGGAYYLGLHRAGTILASDGIAAVASPDISDQGRKTAIAALERENQDLRSEILSLQSSIDSAALKLDAVQSRVSATEKERLALLAHVNNRESAIASLQARLDQAQSALENIRAEYEKAQASVDSSKATLVEDQTRIRDLSEQIAQNSASLSRERELLTAGRDIRELMAARNLHIVDVFDTDPKGKRRPAFGRIFFTEGKSLLFYAYDMPDTRLKDAGYQYRIWGKKEGPNQRARSLGIFFSDDKNQRRWIFQYDDPKVLNEIDSVFVTLEPPNNANPNQPKGDKLLYAYLKGQANHP